MYTNTRLLNSIREMLLGMKLKIEISNHYGKTFTTFLSQKDRPSMGMETKKRNSRIKQYHNSNGLNRYLHDIVFKVKDRNYIITSYPE